jgi:hypothetical protein
MTGGERARDPLGVSVLPLDKPATFPPLRPIAEHRADPELAAIYEDVKRSLGVPWVGVVVQALAYYRPFFIQAYSAIRPTLVSQYFERTSTELRFLAWQGAIERFSVTDHATMLRDTFGYSERELEEIRQLLDVFDYGNPKYFLLATAVREALTGGEPIGAGQAPNPWDLLPRPPVRASSGVPRMLEEHHVDGSLRQLYDDMKSTLGLPFVNSDYKAMARWPTYLGHAWHALKPVIDTDRYVDLRQALNDRCVAAAQEVPHSYRLGRGDLQALGMSTSEIDELVQVIRLFQWLLSGLILNVTYFKIAMHGGA